MTTTDTTTTTTTTTTDADQRLLADLYLVLVRLEAAFDEINSRVSPWALGGRRSVEALVIDRQSRAAWQAMNLTHSEICSLETSIREDRVRADPGYQPCL